MAFSSRHLGAFVGGPVLLTVAAACATGSDPELGPTIGDARPDTNSGADAFTSEDAGAEADPPETGLPCAVRCTVTIGSPTTTTCSAPITPMTFGSGHFIAAIDLKALTELELTFEVCDPTDWVVHVSDAKDSDGYGGCNPSSTNCAETYVLGGTMFAYGNNYAPDAGGLLYSHPGYLAPTGCSTHVWRVSDQRIVADPPTIDWKSPYLLRLNPPVDKPGPPDAIWYLGLNRVYQTATRQGTGVKRATICLR